MYRQTDRLLLFCECGGKEEIHHNLKQARNQPSKNISKQGRDGKEKVSRCIAVCSMMRGDMFVSVSVLCSCHSKCKCLFIYLCRVCVPRLPTFVMFEVLWVLAVDLTFSTIVEAYGCFYYFCRGMDRTDVKQVVERYRFVCQVHEAFYHLKLLAMFLYICMNSRWLFENTLKE